MLWHNVFLFSFKLSGFLHIYFLILCFPSSMDFLPFIQFSTYLIYFSVITFSSSLKWRLNPRPLHLKDALILFYLLVSKSLQENSSVNPKPSFKTTNIATPKKLMIGFPWSGPSPWPHNDAHHLKLEASSSHPIASQEHNPVQQTHAPVVVAAFFREPIFRTWISELILWDLPSAPPGRHTTRPWCARPSSHVRRRDPTTPRRRDWPCTMRKKRHRFTSGPL